MNKVRGVRFFRHPLYTLALSLVLFSVALFTIVRFWPESSWTDRFVMILIGIFATCYPWQK